MKNSKDSKEITRLNIGCGLSAPEGWVNIDGSLSARLSKRSLIYWILCKISKTDMIPWPENIRTLDVTKGIPFSTESVNAIFSSHMIEHLEYIDAKYVISECYRCLRRDGVIRVIVPDLYQIADRYVTSIRENPSSEYSVELLKNVSMVRESYKGHRQLMHKIVGRSKHLYMYDEWSLKEILKEQGFEEIKRKKYGESLIDDICQVEDKGRHELSICLEGIKKA